MKKLRTFSKLITVVAILAMILSLASCDMFNKGGSLKLESFTVDKTSVKTNYLIGEEIDFSGIKATAKYSDESLNKVYTYDELTITYDADITATVGDKYVTVAFDDPNLNVKQETKVQIKVAEEPVIGDEPQLVLGFEQPDSLTSFASNNSSAGQSQYGNAAFSGEFAIGGKTYVVGNANAFKLNPKFTILDETTDEAVGLKEFFAVVEISIDKDGTYVALTNVAGENNVVEYYDGDVLMATVNTYKGEYQFSNNAVGKKVKISVLPSEDYYIFEGNAVVLEAKIIDAYNVYEAWQLAVIDNDTSRADWDDIKTANGIKGLTVSGIVLHNDIELTVLDEDGNYNVPASFFYTTEEEVIYKNSATGAEIKIPEGTKYLKDVTHIYQRNGASDFVIQGNFFTLDASSFPLVPSPGVFGENSGKDYGGDFSNATLIRIATTSSSDDEKPDDVALVSIDNISLIGNSKRDNLIDSTDALASAGGLIFVKSSHHSEITIDNTIGNSYFITYFADYGGDMSISNVKCYDSYQNAAFIWGNSTFNVENSYLVGCGGPVILSQSVVSNNSNPIVTTTGSVINTSVTGQEIWFTAVGATAIMPSIDTLSTNLEAIGLGSLKKDGKMNIMGTLMANGNGLADAIDIRAQGSIFINGDGINRFDTNDDWLIMKAITGNDLSDMTKIPPFLTVNSNGEAYTIWTDGTNFYDLTIPSPYPTPASTDLLAKFMTADTITLTQGGLSVVFEFYHK